MDKPKDSLTTDALKKTIARIEGEKNTAECVFCGVLYSALKTNRLRQAYVLK